MAGRWSDNPRIHVAMQSPTSQTHRNASSRLRFPSPECPLVVCQRTQARQTWESFRHVVCMPVCGVARQPQGLCLGRVASCLILTAYPPAVYVPLDLQYTTAGV